MVRYWRIVLATGPVGSPTVTEETVWLWGTLSTCLERAIRLPEQRRGWAPGAVLSVGPCGRREYRHGKVWMAVRWPLQGGFVQPDRPSGRQGGVRRHMAAAWRRRPPAGLDGPGGERATVGCGHRRW